MTTQDDSKKAAKLAQLQALSATARTATPRPQLPPRPPLRQDVRANSFGDILSQPPASPLPSVMAPPTPPSSSMGLEAPARGISIPDEAAPAAPGASSPVTPRGKGGGVTLDWEALKSRGAGFTLEESSRPVGVRCSQEVFDRLTEARIQSGLDRGHVCAFLLQTYLPRPTKAHVRRGDELATAALAREVRLAQEYFAPEWLIQYNYDSRAPRPHTIAIPVGRVLYAYTSEASLRIGLPLVALVEALVMRYLPQATSRYAKRRR